MNDYRTLVVQMYISFVLAAVFVDAGVYLYLPTICAVCCEGRRILPAHILIWIAASYNVVVSIRSLIGPSFAWHVWYGSGLFHTGAFRSQYAQPRYFGSTVRGVF